MTTKTGLQLVRRFRLELDGALKVTGDYPVGNLWKIAKKPLSLSLSLEDTWKGSDCDLLSFMKKMINEKFWIESHPLNGILLLRIPEWLPWASSRITKRKAQSSRVEKQSRWSRKVAGKWQESGSRFSKNERRKLKRVEKERELFKKFIFKKCVQIIKISIMDCLALREQKLRSCSCRFSLLPTFSGRAFLEREREDIHSAWFLPGFLPGITGRIMHVEKLESGSREAVLSLSLLVLPFWFVQEKIRCLLDFNFSDSN